MYTPPVIGLVLVAGLLAAPHGVQERLELPSSSAPIVAELQRLMQQQKLDAIAARDPEGDNRYAAALVYPGTQIMAITGVYPVPALLNEHLLQREDRQAYVELNRAAERTGRLFVQDLGADGLHASPVADGRVDVVFIDIDARVVFDGRWRDQKLSRDAYEQRYKDADARYAHLLQALVSELKARQPSP